MINLNIPSFVVFFLVVVYTQSSMSVIPDDPLFVDQWNPKVHWFPGSMGRHDRQGGTVETEIVWHWLASASRIAATGQAPKRVTRVLFASA